MLQRITQFFREDSTSCEAKAGELIAKTLSTTRGEPAYYAAKSELASHISKCKFLRGNRDYRALLRALTITGRNTTVAA